MSQTGPQTGGLPGTHAQTEGELSNLLLTAQATLWTHAQMPPQSAPPRVGSQLSFGSSTHLPIPGQPPPPMPPHRTEPGVHLPVVGSQSLPAGQVTAAQRFGPQLPLPSCL